MDRGKKKYGFYINSKALSWNNTGKLECECKGFPGSPLYDSTSQELSYFRVLLKHTLCLVFHCSIFSHLYPLSPWDQCPYANQGVLFRSTVEPTFQNKSALKRHTYFMDLKCSKSKPFWIAKLHGVHNKEESKKKTWCSMTSFWYWWGLITFERPTVDYEHALVVNNGTQRQRNFKRYQESLEPHEMCVVAAGNHGFGFRLPSLVMELLGSLFTVWPL